MIRYLKRGEIDDDKYNNCINSSVNSRIYAYSWYLDIVADNWDVLILNNYEAVMPLPWKSKYFIKYIYPPVWTQQLGVFSPLDITENLIKNFIKSIPRKFKKITIQFNSGNNLNLVNSEKRVNYILALDKPYEEILKGFNNNRKRDLKKALKNELSVNNISLNLLLNTLKKYYLFLNYSRKDYLNLCKLVTITLKKDKGFFLGVYSQNKELVGGSFFLKNESRITYLFSLNSPKGKMIGAHTFLINYMIQIFSNSKLSFDFEGSMVEGIAVFFKSFGSKKENYNVLKKYEY